MLTFSSPSTIDPIIIVYLHRKSPEGQHKMIKWALRKIRRLWRGWNRSIRSLSPTFEARSMIRYIGLPSKTAITREYDIQTLLVALCLGVLFWFQEMTNTLLFPSNSHVVDLRWHPLVCFCSCLHVSFSKSLDLLKKIPIVWWSENIK